MGKRMLIDATHAEETRVVVLNGNRLDEFDVETSTKKQLKGNIYLAKVVRVEPSLQAAFVEYGGNRHGFLAFSEIHPDYYQIPVADRQALLAEQREAMRRGSGGASGDFADNEPEDEAVQPAAEAQPDAQPEQAAEEENGEHGEVMPVEHLGGEDSEEIEPTRRRSVRNYKIQEVIKRRQIILIQVVKEERGNKGAALTTYLSLAGRYCVLMPNTARGGGVSRKITNATDRKRLKSIVNELDIPEGMAVIVRTAGSERTKPEIKRDYEYLLRLWDSVRDLTLRSTAPALVYEEANLIKRSIRDLYSRDIDEILVDGDEGYRLAKDFMRMLTPSHARRVQLFKEPAMPLFHKFQVEAQLDAMHSPVVQLKSGGYLVINQTEALVAIDVNSGRSTKERHIEETALKTNCEAADEVARQLRLRDLAGLIVIDFIDMEETRNIHTVERRLKEAMRFDRARIQLGRISPFGLMELSRQRLRPSLMETSFQVCTHCNGTGLVRSVESASIHVLREIEEEGIRRRSSEVTVTVHPSIALYILNQKRADLAHIETTYGFRVLLAGDETLVPPAYRMDRVKAEMAAIEEPTTRPISAATPVYADDPEIEEAEEDEDEEKAPVKAEAALPENGDEGDGGDGQRRRRRRRRRRGRHPDDEIQTQSEDVQPAAEPVATDAAETEEDGTAEETDEDDAAIAVADGDPAPRRRRRGKRGGRRRNRTGTQSMPDVADGDETDEQAAPVAETAEAEAVPAAAEPVAESAEVVVEAAPFADAEPMPEAVAEPAPKPKRTRAPRKKPAPAEKAVADGEATAEAEPAPKPKRTRAPRKKPAPAATETVVEAPMPEVAVAEPEAVIAAPEAVIAEPPAAPTQESAPAAEEPVPVAVEPVAAPAEPTAPPAPPKKGWWNKLL